MEQRGKKNVDKTVNELEEASKSLASCSYEKNTKWGKEMGLIYGCPAEDIVTGMTIQFRGWKSVYYNPERAAFLGVALTTLDEAHIQYKRWSEGMSQICFSRYCPFTYGHGKILLFDFSMAFPYFQSVIEAMSCGSTFKAWWNLQRMWLIGKTRYFLALFDMIKQKLGLSETTFVLMDKVVTEDVSKRYEQEVMEFGSSTIMFTLMATLALLNLFSLLEELRSLPWIWISWP